MIVKQIVTKLIYSFLTITLLGISYMAPANVKVDSHAQRIITTDWSIGETLLMLNAPIVGIGDAIEYNNWVSSPALPNNIIDLGLRAQPNIEALINANANTLINSSWFQQILPPELIDNRYTLYAVDFYTNEGISWQNTISQTQRLGEITQRRMEANKLITEAQSSMQVNSLRLKKFRSNALAIVQFIDSRHLRIYGNNSLYGVVLDKLKLRNAWQNPTNGWGFQQITLLDLANLPPATRLIIIAPYPVNLPEKLTKNQVWLHLPFVDSNNYRVIPPVWAFGSLPSMLRFSDLLTNSLLNPKQYDWPK